MTTELRRLLSEVLVEYRKRTAKSSELYTRATSSLPGGDTRTPAYLYPYPLFIDHGKGAYIFDVDGNSYLDFSNNWSSLMLGHAHPKIVKAVSEQVAKGSAWTAATECAVELAEIICTRVPSVERIRFTNSGTEAVMLAIRAARAFTGKNKIARASGSYHGSHEELEVWGERAFVDVRLSSSSQVIEFEYNNKESVSQILAEHSGELAAFLLEPFFTTTGMIMPQDGFLEHIREETRRHNVLLIFDEVVTLRVALGGAQEVYGVYPDITAMGKIIGGGFPVGAFGGRTEIMDQFSPQRERFLHHSGTFNANPITMIAGLETLKELNPDVINSLNRLGDRFSSGIADISEERGIKLSTSGLGSLRYMHLTPYPPRTVQEAREGSNGLRRLLQMKLLNDGVVIGSSRGLYVLSTVVLETEVDMLLEKISNALDWARPALEEVASELIF